MEAIISLFIIPTLAGYFILTKSEVHHIRTSYYNITRLAVESLIAGLIFLYVVYCIFGTYRIIEHQWTSDTSVCQNFLLITKYILSKLTIDIKEIWAWLFNPLLTEIQFQNSDDAKKYLISNQSISTLGIAVFLFVTEYIFKKIKPSQHAIKIARERTKSGGQLEHLLNYASDQQEPIQITMGSGKVYVALVKTLPPFNPNSSHHNFLRILPLYSGYRNADDLTITFTTDYTSPIAKIIDNEISPENYDHIIDTMFDGVNVNLNDVTIASIWSREVHDAFEPTEKKATKKKP